MICLATRTTTEKKRKDLNTDRIGTGKMTDLSSEPEHRENSGGGDVQLDAILMYNPLLVVQVF